MITINTLQIDELADKITVNVSAPTGNRITRIYAWNSETFKDYSQAIDLSSYIDPSTETQSFSIFAVQNLEVEKITGLWFFEFESDEVVAQDDCNPDSNKRIGVVANLIPYHECILNKLLATEIEDCKPVIQTDCDECSGNIYYINALLTTLQDAILFGYYEEAIRIVKNLDDLCDICNTCPDYGDTLLVNGLGFSTVNNRVSAIVDNTPSIIIPIGDGDNLG